jgi:hypothetical protein
MKNLLLILSLSLSIQFLSSCSKQATVTSTSDAGRNGNNSGNKQSSKVDTEQSDSTSSNQPPVGVTEAFRKKYPDYTPGDWTKSDNQYSTIYMRESKTYRSDFSEGGEWITTEFDITRESLPKSVLEAFQKSEFGKANNPRFAQLETSTNPVLYRIQGQVNNQPFTLFYSPEGRLVENK